MNKGFTKAEAYENIAKLKEAGFEWDAIVMLGVAGKGNGEIHIRETAKLLNTYPPYLVSIMTTSIADDTPLEKMRNDGDFVECTEREKIEEEKLLLELLEFDDAYFFGGHMYNLISQKQIDIIINNAGVFVADDTITKENLYVRFAVNTISPYILTKLLLPILSEKGRVVNVSSAAQTDVDLNDMKTGAKLYHDMAYAQSKLAIIMRGMEMAQDLGENAVVVSINPKSFLGSKMVKEAYGRQGYDLSFGANILHLQLLC